MGASPRRSRSSSTAEREHAGGVQQCSNPKAGTQASYPPAPAARPSSGWSLRYEISGRSKSIMRRPLGHDGSFAQVDETVSFEEQVVDDQWIIGGRSTHAFVATPQWDEESQIVAAQSLHNIITTKIFRVIEMNCVPRRTRVDCENDLLKH